MMCSSAVGVLLPGEAAVKNVRQTPSFQLIFCAPSGEIAHTRRARLSLARQWLALWSAHLSSAGEQEHGLRFHSTLTFQRNYRLASTALSGLNLRMVAQRWQLRTASVLEGSGVQYGFGAISGCNTIATRNWPITIVSA